MTKKTYTQSEVQKIINSVIDSVNDKFLTRKKHAQNMVNDFSREHTLEDKEGSKQSAEKWNFLDNQLADLKTEINSAAYYHLIDS